MKTTAIVKISGGDKDYLSKNIDFVDGMSMDVIELVGDGTYKLEFESDCHSAADQAKNAEENIRDYIDNNSMDMEFQEFDPVSAKMSKETFELGGQLEKPIEEDKFAKGGTVSNYKGFDSIYVSKLPKAIQDDVRAVKAIAEGKTTGLKTDSPKVQAELEKIENEPTDAEISELIEKAKQHLLDKVKKDHPKAVKKAPANPTPKSVDKKNQLQAKIKGFKVALKFAKGDAKLKLETKIKGFETALKFTSSNKNQDKFEDSKKKLI